MVDKAGSPEALALEFCGEGSRRRWVPTQMLIPPFPPSVAGGDGVVPRGWRDRPRGLRRRHRSECPHAPLQPPQSTCPWGRGCLGQRRRARRTLDGRPRDSGAHPVARRQIEHRIRWPQGRVSQAPLSGPDPSRRAVMAAAAGGVGRGFLLDRAPSLSPGPHRLVHTRPTHTRTCRVAAPFFTRCFTDFQAVQKVIPNSFFALQIKVVCHHQ